MGIARIALDTTPSVKRANVEKISQELRMLSRGHQPTDRPIDQQSEYSAICLFKGWEIEGRDLQYTSVLVTT